MAVSDLIALVGSLWLLNNLPLPCVNTAREGGAEKAPRCNTVAAAGAGAARLTCSTVGTCRGRRRVSPICYLVTVVAGQLYWD